MPDITVGNVGLKLNKSRGYDDFTAIHSLLVAAPSHDHNRPYMYS